MIEVLKKLGRVAFTLCKYAERDDIKKVTE